ncbi:hypothetical protein J3R30DRAFT_113110 [Lentinula aciculospora]|uniref:Uncharacterized protein n=1 Tax=Lentinula aciculospora TaxID=153920 RepID=A0A9W9DY61_9AGAR|nr:hypothetical protein J3R30DRAFT_113110 [Lentinula aciculospora]
MLALASILPSVFLFLVSSPSPAQSAAILRRDNGCNAWPSVGIKDNNNSFELWAHYESRVAVPLAITTFSNQSSDSVNSSIQHAYLAPNDLGGTVIGNLFTLNNSGLIGSGSSSSNSSGESTNTTWISNAVDAGGSFPFSLAVDTNYAGIADDYCEVPNTDPNGSLINGPLFGVQGTTAGWAICNRIDNPLFQGVVFKPAEYSASYGFNFSTCLNVTIYLRSDALGNLSS